MSSTRLGELVKARTPRIPPATVFLMGRLAERQHARALASRSRFAKAYRKVKGKRWKQLRRAMRDAEKGAEPPPTAH